MRECVKITLQTMKFPLQCPFPARNGLKWILIDFYINLNQGQNISVKNLEFCYVLID